jgi:hypothetical protein
MFSEKDLLINLPESDILRTAQGQFSKKIMIVSTPLISTDFCSKVLAAAQIDLQKDTKICSLPAMSSVSLVSETAKISPQKILVFGLEPKRLGLNILPTLYEVFHFAGITWLFAEALDTIEADRTKKGQLWLALKNMFEIP